MSQKRDEKKERDEEERREEREWRGEWGRDTVLHPRCKIEKTDVAEWGRRECDKFEVREKAEEVESRDERNARTQSRK